MTTLSDLAREMPNGERQMASAELRLEVLEAMLSALEYSGLSRQELADRLGLRRSAVTQVLNGTGNVQINTLAEYLFELGCELSIDVHPRHATNEFRTDTRPPRPDRRAAKPAGQSRVTGTVDRYEHYRLASG